eukprot:284959-Pyramimonas_sp.AAC.1
MALGSRAPTIRHGRARFFGRRHPVGGPRAGRANGSRGFLGTSGGLLGASAGRPGGPFFETSQA